MKPRSSIFIAASVLLGGFSTSLAVTLHKADNTTTLQTASSWTENAVPTSADTLVFDNTIASGPLNVSASYLQYAVGTLQFLNPAGNITLNWTGVSTAYQSSFVDMSNSTVDVALTGGTLRIANTTYNPTVSVASGRTLTVNSALSNQGNTKTFQFTGAGNVVINSNSGGGGAMSFNVNGATVTMNNAASGWTAGTVTSGKLVIGNSTVLAGKRITNNAASGLAFGTGVTSASLGGLEGSGSFALVNSNTSAVALTIGSNAISYTISGAISGAGSLIKTGAGTQTFTVANSYEGGTSIEGGQVNLDSTTTTLGSGAVSLSNGAVLQLYRGNATDNVTSGAFANDLAIASGQSGTVYNMARGTWSGAVTGGGTLNLRVNATRGDVAGDWSGFTGQVNVTARTGNDDLRIATGGGGTGLNMAGGKLNLAAGVHMYQTVNPPSGTGTQTVHHIGELSGAAGSSIGGNPISGRFSNWTVGALGTDSIYAGTIDDGTGASSLTKVGSGTLTLEGASTYTGATTISGGALVVNGSLANTSTTVGAAGTLAGSGSIVGTVSVSGTLSPGNSPGNLSTGNQIWSNGGDYNWQVLDATGIAGAGYDTIAITGTLDLSALTAGQFGINLWSLSSTGPDVSGNAANFNNALNRSWTILTTSAGITGFDAADFLISVGANNGTGGFSNALGGGAFSLGQTGNNLVLTFTAIPEPNAAMLVGGLGMLALLRRRRA